jgi:Mg2+ and Co2+ transporter CorA
MKVYWMTPLGKALQETIKEMNIKGELKEKIIEKYEKSIEREFENYSSQINKNTNSSRFKMTGTCDYNNIY